MLLTPFSYRTVRIVDLDGRPHYNATSYKVLGFALRENAIISLHFTEEIKEAYRIQDCTKVTRMSQN